MKNTIYPCLWFDGNAQEAANFYCSIFPESRIISLQPMVVKFELNGYEFMALNGGSKFNFNEATSFVIECETQAEIDHYWESLITDGGSEGNCGWLKDKFGLSWQVVPSILSDLMRDPVKSPKVIEAFFKMKKFDIATLQKI